MKTDISTHKAYQNIFSALVMLPIMGLFAHLSISLTETLWRLASIYCTFASMIIYGSLLARSRSIFKSNYIFTLVSFIMIILPVFVYGYLYDNNIFGNILFPILFAVPIYAGFLCAYQLYAIQKGFFLCKTKGYSWYLIFKRKYGRRQACLYDMSMRFLYCRNIFGRCALL